MTIDFATTSYCAWCGVKFRRTWRSKDQQTCCATHARKMTRWRQSRIGKSFFPCGKQGKMQLRLRGAAVRAASRRDCHFYECACGSYHLTAQANDTSIQAIEILRSKEAS